MHNIKCRAIWQHAAHTTDQLTSPSAKQKPYKKCCLLNEKYRRIFCKIVRRMGKQGERRSDRKSNSSLQKNKRGDSKVESNDSPASLDRGETSDSPGLPSGFLSLPGHQDSLTTTKRAQLVFLILGKPL